MQKLEVAAVLHGLGFEKNPLLRDLVCLLAVRCCQTKSVRKLLPHVDLNTSNSRAMRETIQYGHLNVFRILVEEGGFKIDEFNNFALIHACLFGQVPIIRQLMKYHEDSLYGSLRLERSNNVFEILLNRGHYDMFKELLMWAADRAEFSKLGFLLGNTSKSSMYHGIS
jgi:hypothetical protein